MGGGLRFSRPPRQLVAAGVLTVRDAGSWWLALPGAGRFIRALLRGTTPHPPKNPPLPTSAMLLPHVTLAT